MSKLTCPDLLDHVYPDLLDHVDHHQSWSQTLLKLRYQSKTKHRKMLTCQEILCKLLKNKNKLLQTMGGDCLHYKNNIQSTLKVKLAPPIFQMCSTCLARNWGHSVGGRAHSQTVFPLLGLIFAECQKHNSLIFCQFFVGIFLNILLLNFAVL